MKSRQDLLTVVLVALLGVVGYGLWATSGRDSPAAAPTGGGAPIAAAADQRSLNIVRDLLRLPLTIDESSVAQDAFRLGDKEMDLAFADAVRATSRQVRNVTPAVRAIEKRLEEANRSLAEHQKRVTELARAESTATATEKGAISDRLALARARAELDQDEADDATQDLARAGGDVQGRVQAIIEEHQAASRISDSTHITTVASLEPHGFIGHLEAWGSLHQKALQLAAARQDADSAANAFAQRHDSLERAAPIHASTTAAPVTTAPLTPAARSVGGTLTHDSSSELLRITRRKAAEQKARGRLDQHVANQRELSAVYTRWMQIVHDQQRNSVNHLLRALAIILAIVLVGVLIDRYIEHVLRNISTDRRRTQTLCMVVRVALQVLGVLLILLVIFGRPSNLGTVLGLAGAGLTVAMKDFIVSFFGWFVLLGKDGIAIGDLIEVNGVTGEVLELGMFHTVLLETGNWTDSGHPTGRRVTFTNSFAIEGHYFNFTTSGQWLWDEVRIVVPAGRDPYPVLDALQTHVDAENAASTERAGREGKRNTAPRVGTLGAAPALSIKPIVGGIELTVRYLTHMRERAERRSSLYHLAIELLGEKATARIGATVVFPFPSAGATLANSSHPARHRVVSWPADLDENLLTTTLVGTTLELPSATPELVDALRHDREVLVRDAMLWQRWVRYVALIALAALALAFGAGPRTMMLRGIALTSFAYLACVAVTAELIRRAAVIHEHRLPALLVTADIAALSMLVWLSGTPAEMGRILMGASLVVQLAVFYFGRRLGTYAALLASLAYLCTTYVSPSSEAARPMLPHLLYSLGVFGMVSTVVITAYGNFRERMNRLRLFCKLVEDGDITPSFALGVDKRPDDLTLLARSFEAMRSRLAEQIGTDPLTGCLNRRALESRLRAEWRQAKRRSSTLAVLAIDMDHFKQINDTRGHPFGDIVLQELAGIMKATARDTDAVARLGGDEFVIVLPDTGWEGALTFAERLRRKVDEFGFGSDTAEIRLTISLGVALARGTDPISPEMLLHEADRSLYKAKSGGRNRIFA